MTEHDNQRFLSVLNGMSGASVLVVGDMMLDRFVYGNVERISPESPVPVLSVARENVMLGGAGNTLSNLAHLTCQGKVLSVVGDDIEGRNIEDLAESQKIDTAGLVKVKDRPTIVKTRFLAGHQQLLRADYERKGEVSTQVEKQLLDRAEGLISGVKAVILSDYGKGLLSKNVIQAVIALAKKKGVPVLVDPKGFDYSIYRGADVVTPNKKELFEATGGMPVNTDEEVETAARFLIDKCGISAVVATRSADGMSVITQNDATHIRSAADIEVFDVSGAGDTVIATVAASLAAGADLPIAAHLANIAGSIVVTKVGTAPIRIEELQAAVQNSDGADLPQFERVRQAPVLDWNEAREEVLRWKARGLSVGFTNGCFDIVHMGHVTYLNDARRKCDRLIVGLNSDSSVRILKGAERPVHEELSRSAVMAALGSVDMVVFFGAKEAGDDNTACALLNAVQPDIYFKGGDYTVDQIPEAPTVMRHGGKVDVMPVYEGHSTTSSIEKVKKGDSEAA